MWVGSIPILLGLLTVSAIGWYQDRVSWVSHTKDVLTALDQLLLTATRAETSQRGFLLTGEEEYLRRYQQSVSGVSGALAAVRALTTDNPGQQSNVAELTSLVKNRIVKMNEVLVLRRAGALPAQAAVEAMNTGTVMMDRIRSVTGNMLSEENQLLVQRIAAQRIIGIVVAVVFGLGIIASGLVLFWAYTKVVRYAKARDAAEVGMRQLNAELEQRVDERTLELQDANAQLKRSNEDLTRFAYVASHDLQEPLRIIGSYAGLLGRRYEGKLDERADKYIFYIVDGAKRMQTLVQDLLQYSRSGPQALKFEWISMEGVLANAIENLQFRIVEANAVITHDPLPFVNADPVKMLQVLQNLVGNAIKFRKPEEPPRIHVSASRQGREWVFSVRDNGIGFEPEYSERIFAIFQRLHQIGEYPGTGIGLAIAKRIIEGHGGTIRAESQPGAGATFYFRLPAAEAPATAANGNRPGDRPASIQTMES